MKSLDTLVKVYIEIEKYSNIKYEYDKEKQELVLDRILPYPYSYPYSYGFITHTLAMDGDELDALIITERKIENDAFYDVYIIGVLIMEDEKGIDEKILCVFEEDYLRINDIDDLDKNVLGDIEWFFRYYKSKCDDKWSKIIGYEDKKYAIELYNKLTVL